jgi:hypothetical protein
MSDMLIFVRHYRGRVEEYIAFRKEMLDYLKQQKAAHPELATFLSDMERITSGLPSRIEKDVPDRVAKLSDEFRATLAEIRLRSRKILRNPVAHEFDEGRPW